MQLSELALQEDWLKPIMAPQHLTPLCSLAEGSPADLNLKYLFISAGWDHGQLPPCDLCKVPELGICHTTRENEDCGGDLINCLLLLHPCYHLWVFTGLLESSLELGTPQGVGSEKAAP